MRLSEDKARRLSRLVMRERAWRWLPAVAAGLVLGGFLAFMFEWRISHADRTVDVKVHDATVLNLKDRVSRRVIVVHVHLDDGRDVDATSLLRVAPATGTHVLISEARHASGRLTWDVVRIADR